MMSNIMVSGLDYGEGPRWHGGKLWYSDLYRKAVFTADLAGNETLVCRVPAQPSGLGWLPDGRLLIVSMMDRRVLRQEPSGALVTHADLSEVAPFHANDMFVGPDGQAWVGNFGFDLHEMLMELEVPTAITKIHSNPTPYVTRVAHVSPDGQVTPVGDPMLFPNGMILRDGGLLVSETVAFRIQAYDVGPNGVLSGARTFAAFKPEDGVAPDGICEGPDGHLFVAPALSPQVLRLDASGAVVARYPTRQMTFAVAWDGGENLFAMTAPSSEPRYVGNKGLGTIEHIRLS